MKKIKFSEATVGQKFYGRNNIILMKIKKVFLDSKEKIQWERNVVIINGDKISETGDLGFISDDLLITLVETEDLQNKKECDHYSKSEGYSSLRFCPKCGKKNNQFNENNLKTDKWGVYKDCTKIHNFRIENFIEDLVTDPYCEFCGKKIY